MLVAHVVFGDSWRTFQLAFLLTVMESAVRDDDAFRDVPDLIWFPTGSGKTEAYLGLIAFLIFWRRLKYGQVGGGTVAFMRYTLRLLTRQLTDEWHKEAERCLADRDVPGFAAAVSDRMALLSHRIAGTDFHLGTPSPRVKPLRELLTSDSEWTNSQDTAAQELVRTHSWNCATTRISLGSGTHKVTIGRGGMHIDVVGEPKITRIVDRASFFDFLASSKIKPNVEARIRKRFSP